jgi:antitoxin HicB
MTTEKHAAQLSRYLDLDYPVTVHADPDGGFVAEIRDLPGCITQAETLEEAWELIEEARQLWLEVACERGRDIPLPSMDERYSGRLLLRLPRSLHRRLAERAETEATSVNQYILSLLAEGLGFAEGGSDTARRHPPSVRLARSRR